MGKNVDQIFKELFALIEKEIQWLEREFKYLEDLKSLLSEAKIKISLIHDQNILVATKKSLRRHLQKLFRKVGRIEVRHEREKNKFLAQLKSFLEPLPGKHLDYFIKRLYPPFDVASNNLLKITSRTDGQLANLIKPENFDLEMVLESVQEAIKIGITPLISSLKNTKDYLHKNQEDILDEFSKKESFILDLTSLIKVRSGITPHVGVVLIDANFARSLVEERIRQKKEHYLFDLKYRCIIPEAVYNEMAHLKFGFGAPLVPSKLRGYFKVLGVQIEKVDLNDFQKTVLFQNWTATHKGRVASIRERENFLESGDAKLLGYALKNPSTKVIILSDDSDIKNGALTLNRDFKTHIVVLGFNAGNLKKVA